MSSRLPGFYKASIAERRALLATALGVPVSAFAAIDPGALELAVADGMIENVIGTFALPFAVAVNFTVDGRDVVIPMAVEEPSIVAAASNAARMCRPSGFVTKVSAPVMIGQIQITHVGDVDAGVARVMAAAGELVETARTMMPRMSERGGGPQALDVRKLATDGPDGGVLVAHLHVDCRDAMGANLVNTLCEALADRVAALAGGRPGLRILSNLTDGRMVTVRCSIPHAQLAGSHPVEPGSSSTWPSASGVSDIEGADVAAAIAAASRFAELDPYRATTHNKGIMNGIDAVLVATGQDWRAVEAGAHAYACKQGTYRPLAVWRDEDGALVGELVMPLAVGTVGGSLLSHPSARLALALGGIEHADRLTSLAAAAGLATNLAALRALATEGIQKGHMALHARKLARMVKETP